jgi:oligoribonuclease NrnB/cAMP/cGMP phosphodiesterase (DHH superfamily)
MMNEQKIIVLYHANCLDGFTSAWVAWKKFGDSAVYIPAKHGDEPPEEVFEKGKTIYMLDFFSYPKETIERILENSEKLIVIDHHISVQDLLPLADEHVFNNEESGASLSWKYFYPNEKLPKFIEYVRNHDIWNFVLPKTSEVAEALYLQDFEFEIWDKMKDTFEIKDLFERFVQDGELLIKKRDKTVEKIIKYAVEVEIGGYKGLAVNANIYPNELGHALFEASGVFGAIWSNRGDYINVSLRSGEGGADVSELAKIYGGGGHKHAAGFRINESEYISLNKLFKK